MKLEKSITSSWLAGFIDGEGCFMISFSLRAKMKHGFEIKPSFSCSQKRDKQGFNFSVLSFIKQEFKSGFIRFSKKDQLWKYEVRNIDSLYNNVIPYFDVNLLHTSKQTDFYKFKQICLIIKSNHHLSITGAKEIIELAFSMSKSEKGRYTKEQLLKLLNKVKI